MGDSVCIKPVFAKLRGLGLPATYQRTLDLLERDERMPEAWRSLTRKGISMEEIGPLVRAILQIKDLAEDPSAIPRKLGLLETASKSARDLAEFYHQDPTSTDERKRAEEEYRALKSRSETFKAALKDFWPVTTTKLNKDGVFSTILSRVLVQNFGAQMDDLVATVTTVLFDLPEPLAPNTVGTRLRREESRRTPAGK